MTFSLSVSDAIGHRSPEQGWGSDWLSGGWEHVPMTFSLSVSDAIGPRSKGGAPIGSVMDGDTRKLEEVLVKGEGRATLKMRRDGEAVVEEVVSSLSGCEERKMGLKL